MTSFLDTIENSANTNQKIQRKKIQAAVFEYFSYSFCFVPNEIAGN